MVSDSRVIYQVPSNDIRGDHEHMCAALEIIRSGI